MKAKLVKDVDNKSDGGLILLYGNTGAGKSTTTLLEMFRMCQRNGWSKPPLYIQSENRNIAPTLKCIKSIEPDFEMEHMEHEDVKDTVETLNTADLSEHRVIMFDSLSDFMALKAIMELKDESAEARSDSGNINAKKKELIMASKGSTELYGALEFWTNRLTTALANLAQEGKYVFVTARVDHNPAWAKFFDIAPLLKGKAYGQDFAGQFDYIGYVEQASDKETGDIVYPPRVSFKSNNEDFVAKWCGPLPVSPKTGNQVQPINMPLKFEMIFGK